MNSQIDSNILDRLRLEMLSSQENFTRAMFKAQYKRSFIVSEHHRRIFEALQDVVDGKCTRLIINLPPRYGKCCHPDTQVLTTKGLVSLRDIQPGDKVYSFDNGKASVQTCLGKEPAYKPSVKVTMRSGRTIICSDDHPLLTPFGYIKAGDLDIGSRIYAINAQIDSDNEIDDNELLFTTMIIFEGNCSNPSTIRFACNGIEVLEPIKKACANLGIDVKHYACCKSFEYNVASGKSSVAYKILDKYDLLGHTAYTKRLPKEWIGLSARQKYMFIDLMIATDGWVAPLSGQVGISLANRALIEDIQYLLSTVGIVSTISYKNNDCAGAWQLVIPRKYAVTLLDKITFYQKRDKALQLLEKESNCSTDTYPFDIIRKEHLTGRTRDVGLRCSPYKNITADKFDRLVQVFPQLAKYKANDFYLDTVVDVQDVGYQELVHIEVSNTHNFIANGLVSHNTETAIKQFISWCFALNPTCRFLHLSYSDALVNDNSLAIRQTMMEPLYKELFPGSTLEKEKGSTDHWRTKAGGELYAVSTQGQVTGFGAGKVDEEVEANDLYARDSYINNIATKFGGDQAFEAMLSALEVDSNIFQGAILIDDPLKPEDAQSEVTRERINMRFESTIRNRTNSRSTPIIIIMQRLHEHDLCGYLMEKEPDEWRVLSLPAIQTNEETGEEKPLWPVKHTLDELHKLREIEPLVFDTQYMQDPTPREGLMYENGFEEYTPDELEQYKPNQKMACNYTDTADTGADSLCSICFIDTSEYIYVTDVLFTTEPMEKTEPQTAKMLNKNKTINARIESNNGGRGFARKIQSLLRVNYHNFRCTVHWFHQSANKYARIYNMSATTQAIVKFPKGWKQRWPKFHAALMSYRKDTARKTVHDDAPDCLTGCVEMKIKGTNQKKIKRRN